MISGDPDTVHQAKVSVRGKVKADDKQVGYGEWQEYVVCWPALKPMY
ncbi:hypothetical protein [Labrys neptuniae]